MKEQILTEAEFLKTLNAEAQKAFLEQVEKREAGGTCELTGMPEEPMSREQAVEFVQREWQAWDRTMESIKPAPLGRQGWFKQPGKNGSPAGAFFMDFEEE